jgi:hypothetical protein
VIAELRAAFARDGFADVTPAIDGALRERIMAEASATLDAHGVRRDVRIAATGLSPRRYRVAARDAIAANAPAAADAYRSSGLLAFVAQIAGQPVAPVPYVPEQIIATRLERCGDTHGWHWDDYAFALIWIADAPPPRAGGSLEYVTGVTWRKDEPRVEEILRANPPQRRENAPGTVYLLRADTTLHRVAPLLTDARRDAMCFSYAATSDLGRTVSHETLDAILGATTSV